MFQVIGPDNQGPCPHCGITVRLTAEDPAHPRGKLTDASARVHVVVVNGRCPSCNRPVVLAHEYCMELVGSALRQGALLRSRVVWPGKTPVSKASSDVPIPVRSDFEEAAEVLPISEKASAALSRRCLQSVLREAGGTKSRDLADQIDEVLPKLPGYLQAQLDAVRNIGNFAAHPQKSRVTGEIIDVEPGEAEWNLEVLDLLFDFYYVQPKMAAVKRAALDKKLAEVGKPPMK